tara:strand:+ start:36 stop:368 length:333 start_codon:yes stop_codon:yes gene_type:complete
MEVKGKLVKKLQQEAGTSKAGKAWVKQTIVIDTEADYNNIVAIECFGEDRVKLLNSLKVGDIITVECNVFSREFKGRYFHNIQGWKFTKNSKGEDSSKMVTFDDDENTPF